jgi:L-2-hydroxyglutarate oxidase
MSASDCEVVVIGGGIVGLAVARALQERGHRAVVVLEAEERLAMHQSGRNSGVIHAGLYYRPGSLKARLCAEGREAMFAFCEARGIPCRRSGKLVIAADEGDLPGLAELERRARENGIEGVRRIGPEEVRAFEPNAGGVAALHVPVTGITDYPQVMEAMVADIRSGGGELRLGWRALAARDGDVDTPRGRVRARFAVNCAGLQCDRVARACGVRPGVRIVPFRGEYWRLRDASATLVRGLIYPVPDPKLPFLGVHFSLHTDGAVEAGPNAMPVWHRHAYRPWMFSFRDAASTLSWPGFWRLAWRHRAAGLRELRRTFSLAATARALQRLVPGVRAADLQPSRFGVRAQAVERDGRLVDDFRIAEGPRSLHVLNAPSPAATASLAIGRHVAGIVEPRLGR